LQLIRVVRSPNRACRPILVPSRRWHLSSETRLLVSSIFSTSFDPWWFFDSFEKVRRLTCVALLLQTSLRRRFLIRNSSTSRCPNTRFAVSYALWVHASCASHRKHFSICNRSSARGIKSAVAAGLQGKYVVLFFYPLGERPPACVAFTSRVPVASGVVGFSIKAHRRNAARQLKGVCGCRFHLCLPD
jgi:hypothetical protein